MDTNGSLPQFSLFPLEIRRLIWKSCLPRRIAEEDFPYTLLDGKEGRQACWPVRSVLQNARVPLLATVCAESREVVFEWGGHQVSQDETSLKSIWLQPKMYVRSLPWLTLERLLGLSPLPRCLFETLLNATQ